jgi:murein DD-endopeptidase MepM/ murein hydrolase activator NlpD
LIFRKKKYHFDPATLIFEEIKPDRKKKFLEFTFYVCMSMLVTILSGYLLSTVFGSAESKILERRVSSLNLEMRLLIEKGSLFSSRLRKNHFPKDNNYRMILQIDTLPYSLRDAGTGGSAMDAALSLNNNTSYQLDNLITKLHTQLQIQTGSYETVFEKAREHALQLTHMPAIQPINQNDLVMISSNFGIRSDPFLDQQEVHSGLDFVAAVGKNVYATGDGTVTFVQISRTGYGNEIVIDHAFGFGSRYAHLDQVLVTEGQKIKRGQIIGKVGQSGRATGPHLHYEVLYENKPVNPAFYYDNSLTVEEYQQILKMASNKSN